MPKPNQYALILGGGRGTRFWPRSRRRNAKQVLSVAGERTLIQATVDRLAPLVPPERIWVMTNEYLRAEIARQLPEVPAGQILAEPAQRNTAPAIGLGAVVLQSIDPDAVMGVFPADHVIGKPRQFLRYVRSAYREAEKGSLMVLGLQPRWPETGYGYIEMPNGTEPGSLNPQKVVGFREKPDLATAKRYLAAGRYFWNAGMFFWRADVFLAALRRHLPKCATLLSALPAFGSRPFRSQVQRAFPVCPNVSVDFAILEKANNVMGLACGDFGWSDVGSWDAVYELLPKDGERNVSRSGLLAVASRGNYVDAGDKLVALLGVDDLIVVDTPDALLVARRDRAQGVGELVKLLERRRREDLL
ncbi:MAG: mannose-1-phosphate guanylyltransferase [Bryobacteraceae bacterium]